MTLFSLRGICRDVPGRRLVDGLDLDIPEGVVTALIGRNGSGKSTVLKMLAGQHAPSAGSIGYAGQDLSRWTPRALARHLAYLPQVTPASEGMRLEELVALGRYPWRGALGRFRDEDTAAVEEAITRCGLARLKGRIVDTMSGGERQRAWIAVMLAQGARTLLLDEPISALDIAHQVEVLALLRAMCREGGMSVVVVLHDVNMVARYCDHVVALGAGRLVFEGPVSALMTADTLQRIYGLPMTVSVQENQVFALPGS